MGYSFTRFIVGKLQWERDIPQDALNNLVSLANSDFHQNLGKIIHDIYLTGHNLFKDMPQGNKLIIQFLEEMHSLISNKNTKSLAYEESDRLLGRNFISVKHDTFHFSR